MCGPFKGTKGILRLLEIIFSALAFIIVLFRGTMVSPWGVWCVFVWLFCIIVPLVITIMEAMSWHVLLAAFLPDWADLTCGLTTLCAVMITSATIIFAAVFVCIICIISIFCFIFSLIATVVFWIDTILQRKAGPNGYLCGLRGSLRMAEAFIACIIITAALDHFLFVEWYRPPIAMIFSVIIFVVCLVVTVVIIILNLVKLLQAFIPVALTLIEFVFNIVAVVLYVLAVILWCVFAYRRYRYYNYYYYYYPYNCKYCSYADRNTVTVGAIINLILYIVDLYLSFKAR